MRVSRRRAGRAAALVAAAGLVLAACGGGDIEESGGSGSDPAAADCGTMNMAINPWTGFEASAYVVGTVAQEELACDVEYKTLKEEISWQGFENGDVDVIIENWGHDDLKKTYIEEQDVAVEVGPNGNVGIIGWYVPPWLAEAEPDVLNWENLNDYADEFATSESGGKGQFLGGDPSFVQFDEAIIENLDLDFQVVYAGGEAGLISAFRKAEENQEWLIGYFYAPQYFFAEVDLQRVALPPYTEGCDKVPADVACDYAELDLDKIARKEFMDTGSPAADLVQSFEWTNEDQNLVASYINDGMDAEDAAAKWIEDNPDKVAAWLP